MNSRHYVLAAGGTGGHMIPAHALAAELTSRTSHRRSEALAERLERGARALEELALTLTRAQWEARLPHDGRKIGVVVHHVASMYPIEMQFALTLNRAGTFTLELTATDVLSGQTSKVVFPVRVLAP